MLYMPRKSIQIHLHKSSTHGTLGATRHPTLPGAVALSRHRRGLSATATDLQLARVIQRESDSPALSQVRLLSVMRSVD